MSFKQQRICDFPKIAISFAVPMKYCQPFLAGDLLLLWPITDIVYYGGLNSNARK